MNRGLKLLAGCALFAVAACNSPQTTEGNEAPDAKSVSPEAHGDASKAATDKVVWLSQLMLIRGHLHSGAKLYAEGDAEGGAVHMKHPEDELYADLKPAFTAWGAKEFAPELQALATSVEGGAAQEKVQADLTSVQSAIDAAADVAKPTVKELLLATVATLRTAGEEFDLAVDDGKIVNVREYQDAHGFITTALAWLDRAQTRTSAEQEAVKVAREQVVMALAVAPNVSPPEKVKTQSITIIAVADKVEAAARGLKE